MPLVKRTTKGSKLTIAEMDGNFDYFNFPNINRCYTDPANLVWAAVGQDTHRAQSGSTGFDTIGFGPAVGNVQNIILYSAPGPTITGFSNMNLLTSLEDIGTSSAITATGNPGLTAVVIDDLFTQLPSTTKTATINVQGCPGAATCNPAIATAKGYTVVT